jgi:hypothetical protein
LTRAQRIEKLSRQGPIQNWERIVELEDALRLAEREHNALVTIANWPWGELSRTLEESWHALRDHARAALAREASE